MWLHGWPCVTVLLYCHLEAAQQLLDTSGFIVFVTSLSSISISFFRPQNRSKGPLRLRPGACILCYAGVGSDGNSTMCRWKGIRATLRGKRGARPTWLGAISSSIFIGCKVCSLTPVYGRLEPGVGYAMLSSKWRFCLFFPTCYLFAFRR